jgi:hypothetical protein
MGLFEKVKEMWDYDWILDSAVIELAGLIL